MGIGTNVENIKEEIYQATQRAGREYTDVRLIAASKYATVPQIKQAFAAGVEDFGENRVQDGVTKMAAITEPIHWHFIGQLQTNKVKFVSTRFDMIHSLDRQSVADKLIELHCQKPVLVQVNIGREPQKGGVFPEELFAFLDGLAGRLPVAGLMTIPPRDNDKEASRPYFKAMWQLFTKTKEKGFLGVSMEQLSMGMSNDFSVAIEEGATMIRVGQRLFLSGGYK